MSRSDGEQEFLKAVKAVSPRFNWVGVYWLSGDELVLGEFIGKPTPHTRIPVGVGVCGTAVATGDDQIVQDVRARENYLACSIETRSELVVLIRDKDGKVLGQVDIDSDTPDAFSESDVGKVRTLAAQFGLKIR